MMGLHPILESYIPIVEGLGATFGENCEVVLHDIQNLSSSVIAISNRQVSGRDEGAPITNLGLNIIKRGVRGEDLILNYQSIVKEKTLKSSSMMIRDENNELLGCLCINYDITNIRLFEGVLKELTKVNILNNKDGPKSEEKFSSNVTELTSEIIRNVIKEMNKPVEFLSKDEKIRFVHLLDEKGIFLIKGVVQEIADLLNVSKYTVYNYLEKNN